MQAARWVITTLFLLAGAWYVRQHWHEFRQIAMPSATAVSIVVAMFLANLGLRAWFNRVAMSRLGTGISLHESFMLSLVAAAGNFVLPMKAGAGIRAAYLKQVHGFPFSQFAGVLVLFSLVSVLVGSLAGLCALVWLALETGYFRLDLFLVLPLVSLGIVGVMLLGRRGFASDGHWFEGFRNGFRKLVGEVSVVPQASAVITAGLMSATVAWIAALHDLDPAIRIQDALIIAVSQLLAGLATITPGGLGFQEVAGVYAGQHFQMTTVELLAVLVWVRIARMITTLVLALPSLIYLNRRISA